MTLNAQGMVQNVKASLEKYIHDNLVVEEGLNVDFEGTPFEVADAEEWIQERILGFVKQDYHRQTSETLHGQTTQVLLSMNVFVDRNASHGRTNRHYEIRDTIAEYFKVGTVIDLYDFSQDDWSSALQKLFVFEVVTDTPIPNADFHQYTLTYRVDWLEEW